MFAFFGARKFDRFFAILSLAITPAEADLLADSRFISGQ
jgi:hypothetical protein